LLDLLCSGSDAPIVTRYRTSPSRKCPDRDAYSLPRERVRSSTPSRPPERVPSVRFDLLGPCFRIAGGIMIITEQSRPPIPTQNPGDAFQTGFGTWGPSCWWLLQLRARGLGSSSKLLPSGTNGPVSKTIDSNTVIIAVSFAFNLPISGTATKRIQLHNYRQPWAGNNRPFSCQPYAYHGGTSAVNATGLSP
jgi:hypothetical protein